MQLWRKRVNCETKGKSVCVCAVSERKRKIFVFSARFSAFFAGHSRNCYNVVIQSLFVPWLVRTLFLQKKNLSRIVLWKFNERIKFWRSMSVRLDMWRFSDDISTARRYNAVAARMQPHCPVLYSGKQFFTKGYRNTIWEILEIMKKVFGIRKDVALLDKLINKLWYPSIS